MRLFTTLFPLITLAIHVAGIHPPQNNPPDQHHQLPSPPESAYLGGRPSSVASSVTLVDDPGVHTEHGETRLPTRPEDVYASGRERVSTAGSRRVSQFDIEGQQSVPRRVTSQSCRNCINQTLHIAGQVAMCPVNVVCCLTPEVVADFVIGTVLVVAGCGVAYEIVAEIANAAGAHLPSIGGIRRALPSEPEEIGKLDPSCAASCASDLLEPGSQHPKRDLAKSIYRRRLEQED
ncbi:hypothetical protein FB446DRAFT_702046 [Lentinula raphanica]|nr:hypothetical protein FB446DRAFT_702046 [Lentinula raphanica]